MRKNLPVTNNHIDLIDGRTIVSTTDLKGRITFANPYFVEVSGFELSELIGAPQNIVRHPDMPAEAFADMWETIKMGLPWTGLVKNRCKNGDYYWVNANVTPVFENGSIVGYMSVRTKPLSQEITVAEELYAKMRNSTATLNIRHGHLVHKGLKGKLLSLSSLGLATQAKLFCATIVAMSAIAAFGNEYVRNVAVCVSVCMAIAWWLSIETLILNPIKRAASLTMRFAGGDMTSSQEAATANEMGNLLRGLNQVGTNLRSVISDVRSSFNHMQKSTSELAAGNADLSKRTESQAANLEETASSMEQLARSVEENSEHLKKVDGLTDQAVSAANEGSASVSTMLASMDAAASASRQVLEITQIIESIAFQTNLLALNAAVEAARAGEHGRGFAVVAGEVRALAARCSSSAKEVATLVNASIASVDAGVQSSHSVGERVTQVVQAIGDVKLVLSNIATAADEQARGVTQVNAAVTELDQLTQKNAALVEESASATEALVEETNGIAQTLAVFKLKS